MHVPYSWLREYVPTAPSPEEIAERLALVGTEVERLTDFGVPGSDNGGVEGYLVGRVVGFEQHPNADRLRLCRVDVGEKEPRQIVCGAANFAEGDTVAVVLPGATLPGGETMGTAKLRGVESHGMMLSERELSLSTDHGGIMVLPPEWQPGEKLTEHMPIGDRILELEITSNRPDCLSVFGIAREVAAAFDLPLEDAWAGDAEASGAGSVGDVVSVDLQAGDLCPRYMARAFVDLQVAPSPHWLRARLAAAGMRAINNVVDVTNYVMLMCGQPLHAFDADKLSGGKIIVRRAAEGEQVTTLDEVERTLDATMLSIADADRTAVIAGVMGAADVEVSEQTTRIVLEAACFVGPNIMQTSSALGLRSESSSRFEKGLDPYLPEVALRLASNLLVEVCGARMLEGTIDQRGEAGAGAGDSALAGASGLAVPPTIALREQHASEVLGVDVPRDEAESILQRLGFEVAGGAAGDTPGWQVTVPHWRMLDVTRPIDLVEEVGRIFGLDRIPSQLPARRAAIGRLTRLQRLQRLLEDAAVGLGLHETLTYSLVDAEHNSRYGMEASLALGNPMSAEHAHLRGIALGGLLEVVRRNRAVGAADVALFEYTRVFAPTGDDGTGDAERREPPALERQVLVICVAGALARGRYDAAAEPADFAAIAGVVQALLTTAGVESAIVPAATERVWLHPGLSADLQIGGQHAGWLGVVHPSVAGEFDIRGDVVAAEIDIAAIEAALPELQTYSPISQFPPVRQDIALIVADTVLAGDVVATVREAGGELLEQVEVFDRYQGSQVPEGTYSVALRLVFRAPDRTLTDDEVLLVREAVVAALTERFDAKLRD